MCAFSTTIKRALSSFRGTSKSFLPASMSFPLKASLQCNPRRVNSEDYNLSDRQERLFWWKQAVIHRSRVLIVGAGGLGSNAGHVFVQMGIGRLDFVDPDIVEDSNRNRQRFTADDVGKPKAHALLANLAPYATFATELQGYFGTFQDCASEFRTPDVVLCGVDNDEARVAVARFSVLHYIPVVFIAVSKDGEAFSLFIQRPRQACLACRQPSVLEPKEPQLCIPVPAIADILQVAAGFGARAVVGELLGSPISDEYNLRQITFTKFDIKQQVQRNPDCVLCGEAYV